MRFVSSKGFKFYLYLSKSKVDMLYGQLNVTKKKTSTELKGTAGIASSTRKTEEEEDISDTDKLENVIAELDDQQLIGTLEEPKDYVRGTVSMRWGLYDDNGMRPASEGPFVYFGGYENGVLIGLGGSSRHVQGFYGSTSTGSRSATPALVAFLLSMENPYEQLLPYASFMKQGRDQMSQVYEAMQIANHYLRPPDQDLEFVAKVVDTGIHWAHGTCLPEGKHRVILGTPLYVAQVHRLILDDPSGVLPGEERTT